MASSSCRTGASWHRAVANTPARQYPSAAKGSVSGSAVPRAAVAMPCADAAAEMPRAKGSVTPDQLSSGLAIAAPTIPAPHCPRHQSGACCSALEDLCGNVSVLHEGTENTVS